MGWSEVFGQIVSSSRNRTMQYEWAIFPMTGLEYRPNDHFYFGLTTLPFSYTSTKVKDNPNRITMINVFYDASAYVVLKF